MKRKIILLLILFIPLFSFCQEFLWAEQEGSYLIDRWSVTESGLDIKYDSQGNIIVSGYYEGNALFGENNEITLTYNSSFYNLFIAKYNPIGQLIWVKYPTGTGSSKGNGIAIDNEDNIIMTGVFCGQKIFGYGEPNQTTLYCPVMWDFFIAKYDSSGDLIWVNQEGNPPGSTSFEGLNVAISDNDIYVTGRFRGEFIFSSGNPNVDTLFCDGNWDDIFLAKYDSSGNFQWAQRAGGDSFDEGLGLDIDNGKNIYLCGFLSDTAIFGVNGEIQIIRDSSYSHPFVYKCDQLGVGQGNDYI